MIDVVIKSKNEMPLILIIYVNNITSFTFATIAAVAQSVTAFASHAEGCVLCVRIPATPDLSCKYI